MLETFCAAANMKAFLRRPDCPAILQKSLPVLEEYLSDGQGGTLSTDIRTLVHDDLEEAELTAEYRNIDMSKGRPVAASVKSALLAIKPHLEANFEGWTMPTNVFPCERYTIRGMDFAIERVSRKMSAVCYQPFGSDLTVPGVIREIFAVHRPKGGGVYAKVILLAIQRRRRLGRTEYLDDPLARYPAFGATLWSEEFLDGLDVITTSQQIHHSISRPWADGAVVIKSLDRVRSYAPDISSTHSAFY